MSYGGDWPGRMGRTGGWATGCFPAFNLSIIIRGSQYGGGLAVKRNNTSDDLRELLYYNSYGSDNRSAKTGGLDPAVMDDL